jgi:phosphoribosylformylglycinamidine synthase
MDAKIPGDLLYILGTTRNELGGSEYYEHLGYIGSNVPRVRPDEFMPLYRNLCQALEQELVASAHGIYRGGLAVHLAMVAMGGNLGLNVDLAQVPADQVARDDRLLFSESAGRFLVTVDPVHREAFEDIFKATACRAIGTVTEQPDLVVRGRERQTILAAPVADLKTAWKKTFGELI